jgi:hypothetical protein
MTASRRRSTLRDLQSNADGDIVIPKVINAAPSLEKAEMYGIDDNRSTSSRMLAMAGRIFIETIPQWLAVGGMLGLIFGGCCSNVSCSWLGPRRKMLEERGGLLYIQGLCAGSYCKVSGGSANFILLVQVLIFSLQS